MIIMNVFLLKFGDIKVGNHPLRSHSVISDLLLQS